MARALQEAGLLEKLVTDIYWPADRGSARRIEGGMPVLRILRLSACRNAAGVPADAVKSCWLSGMSSLMANKAPWLPFQWEREAVRWCDRSLGRRAGRIATRKNAALLSYSYYAHSAFSQYEGSGPRILFQLHPHAASVRSILWRERQLIRIAHLPSIGNGNWRFPKRISAGWSRKPPWRSTGSLPRLTRS